MSFYRVKNICANCGQRVKWFKGVKVFLHFNSRKARCIQYTRAEATPTVRPVKKRKK